jgi:diguanylate cyclase (GGDEF)-like protein
MLTVDPLTAFVICGAASCVAGALTSLVRPDERHLREALRLSAAGFLALGVGLFQLVFGVESPGAPRMFVALLGASIGIALFAWGMARLTDERVRPQAGLFLIAGVLLLFGPTWGGDGWGLQYAFLASTTLLSLLAVLALRRFLLRPRNASEQMLGLALAGFAFSWVLRILWTLQHTGPLPTHHILAPEAIIPGFAIFYGVVPIFLATMLLSVINARLEQRLALRALTDELTGAMTRRALRELAPETVARAQAQGDQVAVLMLDIDYFKNVNDLYGHLVGDEVLRTVAHVVRDQLRGDALLTRYGGEEFALLVPVPDVASARHVADRLRRAVAERPYRTGELTLPVTASVGLTMLGPEDSLEAALTRADEALYRAKRSGRDRVEASLEVAA